MKLRYFLLLLVLIAWSGLARAAESRLNLLFITSDDLSCDSVGVFGCPVPATTPVTDRLASECLRFNHAFVQVGNCMPSRNVMFSGRYPHNNGVEGFYEVPNPGYKVMADLAKDAGYFTAIRGKVSHSTPYSPYPAWDLNLDTLPDGSKAHPKNVDSYYASMKMGLEGAKKAGKPFFLEINISDPHVPFYAMGGKPDPNVPTRIFKADEITVPGFLPDDPGVRAEMALYYSSVRRGDDCLGKVLQALDESGEKERTLIVYLSDHGMPLPFAKTQLYYHSAHTPLMFRWPGVTKSGAVDDRHFVSSVDLLPTLAEALGWPLPEGLDGRSFAPVLRGEIQEGRDQIVAEYNENSGHERRPMRALITKDFSYIFSPWSNGTRVMSSATMGTSSYKRMLALAKTDPNIAARVGFFQHRVPEEMYNYATDPDALNNLIQRPEYQTERTRLTKAMEDWMVKTKDPMLPVLQGRDDLQVREAFMAEMEKKSKEHPKKAKGRGGKGDDEGDDAGPAKGAGQGGAKKPMAKKSDAKAAAPKANLFTLQPPASASRGTPVVVEIAHKLPAELGTQTLQVSLRESAGGKRFDRQSVKITGEGTAKVSFDLPADLSVPNITVAAFIGDDFNKNLQYVVSKPVPVK